MRKLLIILMLMIVPVLGLMSQAVNKAAYYRIANSSTAFGVNLPIGTLIYDVGGDKLYELTAAASSANTLTTATKTQIGIDNSISNEGSLTVAAGSSTTSVINSNTSGSTGVTLTAGTGLSISETSNTITLTNTVTNTDAQDLGYTASTGTVTITGGNDATIGGFGTANTDYGLVVGSNGVGSTYYLDASGTWSVPNTGTNYWSRSGTDLSPATSGDDLLMYDTQDIAFGDSKDWTFGYPGTSLAFIVEPASSTTINPFVFQLPSTSTQTASIALELNRVDTDIAANDVLGRLYFSGQESSTRISGVSLTAYATGSWGARAPSKLDINVGTATGAGIALGLDYANGNYMKQYGSGNITGTPTYDLQVAADGTIVEVAISGGSSYWSRSSTDLSPATSGDDVVLDDDEIIIMGTGKDVSISYNNANGDGIKMKGVTTISPTSLQIETPFITSGGAFPELTLHVNNSTISNDDIIGKISFNGFETGSTFPGATITALATGNWSTTAPTELVFLTAGTTQGYTVLTLNPGGDGDINFGAYGSGSHTGTATYIIGVDASGNLVEETLPTGGGNVSNTGTPLNNQLAVWTNATTIEGDADLTWTGTTLSVSGEVATTLLNVSTSNASDGQLLFEDGGDVGFTSDLSYTAASGLSVSNNLGIQGLFQLTSSTTGGATLNIPHGSAPTVPDNGDIWTTTAGLYVQINGSTVGPLGTGGGGSPAGSSTYIQYNTSGAFDAESAFTYSESTNTMNVDWIDLDDYMTYLSNNTTDGHAGGLVTRIAGGTIAAETVVYLTSTSLTLDEADADAATTMPAIGFALNTDGDILTHGVYTNTAWNWTVGGEVYVSTTAGQLTQTAPSGLGDQVQVVGIAIHADMILFTFDNTLIER